ncbi:hypothetical protein LUZ60_005098 [Juncus effusus]|nr:hypothetical protein LUZ60_005098 [Juncus effusus]
MSNESKLLDGSSSGHRKRKGKKKENARAEWTEVQRAGLVSSLVEYGAKEWRTDNGWSNRAWTEIKNSFTEKFPNAHYSLKQIKEQEQHLKKKFKSLKNLLSLSGLGWSHENKMVKVVEGVWEDIVKNNKDARQWHDKSFPYYDDLYGLYHGRIAEGLNKRGSNQYNLDNDSESPHHTPSPTLHTLHESTGFPWQDAFINDQNTSFSLNEDPNFQPVTQIDPQNAENTSFSLNENPNFQEEPSRVSPSTRSARPSSFSQEEPSNRVGRNKKAKTTKMLFSPFNEEYFTFRKEETNMYISAMKEIEEKKGNDRFAINAAIIAFKALEENGFTFEFDDLDKAITLFMSSVEIREAFITLEPKNRALWIRRRIDNM